MLSAVFVRVVFPPGVPGFIAYEPGMNAPSPPAPAAPTINVYVFPATSCSVVPVVTAPAPPPPPPYIQSQPPVLAVRHDQPLEPPPPPAEPLNVTTIPESTVMVYMPGVVSASIDVLVIFCDPLVGPFQVITCACPVR